MSALPSPSQQRAAPGESTPYYVPLPRRLVEDLRDSPIAIGVYALIGRIFRATKAPVPLSPGDLQAIDPSLSYGAATRALQRLAAEAYVAVARSRGRKSVYIPTWGAVRGSPLHWDLTAPCLGRPRHVPAIRLDQRILDTCVGRVRPNGEHPAVVDRYFSQPLLAVEDVGLYARSLAGLSAECSALSFLGLLDAHGRAQPLADDFTILAVVSQRVLYSPGDGRELTAAGWERTAFAGLSSVSPTDSQVLFFVPKDQIAHLIAPGIAHPISSAACDIPADPASERRIRATGQVGEGSHGLMELDGKDPSTTVCGGGKIAQSEDQQLLSLPLSPDSPPQGQTSMQLLLNIGVRRSIAGQLAGQPAEQVARIIAEARARGDVRNLPAWVVSSLRDLPDVPADAPPAPRVSDKTILLHPGVSPRERQVWLHRFRSAEPADRPAILARFHQEVAHAVIP